MRWSNRHCGRLGKIACDRVRPSDGDDAWIKYAVADWIRICESSPAFVTARINSAARGSSGVPFPGSARTLRTRRRAARAKISSGGGGSGFFGRVRPAARFAQ